jgi:eukaryotic-like serine/threonine-protein kinase
MERDEWQKSEEAFHHALSLDKDLRETYLEDLAKDSPGIAAEVYSLLDAYENDSSLLDSPVADLGLRAIHQTDKQSRENTVVGVFSIGKMLGSGGMGEVYEALDTRLNRRVALKFLSDSYQDDGIARRRLQKEAQAIAMLEHPNICTVYGLENEGTDSFLVMQFIDGVTLDKRIEKLSMDPAVFRSIALQIAQAVAFAHSHGVIHRDLKPGNIMLSENGNIKVLDFGLAKIVDNKKTPLKGSLLHSTQASQKGLVFGTVSYMSPEQLRGDKLGYQSDVFSLGVIFHELLTKVNPFQRDSQAETIAAILGNDAVDVRQHAPGLASRLAGLINKCLERDRSLRFASVAEILIELDNLDERRPITWRIGPRAVAKIVLSVITILLLASLTLYFTRTRQMSMAVLPVAFADHRPEGSHFAEDINQGLMDKLSELSGLRVKGDAYTSRYLGQNVDAQQIGRDLGVDAVFRGMLQMRSDGVYLKTETIRTSDGLLLDTNESKIEESRVSDVPDAIIARIVNSADLRLSGDDVAKLSRKDTESTEAKNFYLTGRYLMKRRKTGDDLDGAIQAFTSAKDIDQNYARAWAGLADAYLLQSSVAAKRALTPKQAVDLARLAAKRAIDLDNSLADSYNSLGSISSRYDWNWKDAENYFRTAISRDAEFLPAYFGLINVLKMEERYDEALVQANKVKDLDPLSINADIQIALINYRKRDYAQTDRILKELLQRSPDDPRVKYVQVYEFLKTDRVKEAVDILEPLYNSKNEEDKVLAAAPLGFAYARMGSRAKALAVIGQLDAFGKDAYVPSQEKALIYVALGDRDRVFENLRLSCAERFSSLPGWINDPIVDEVRDDPRFGEIRQCVNL